MEMRPNPWLILERKATIGSLDWDFGYARNSSEFNRRFFTPASVPLCMHHLVTSLPGTPKICKCWFAYTSLLQVMVGV